MIPSCTFFSSSQNRMMGGCDRFIPSSKAMRDSHAYETYRMAPPQTDYQKAIARTLFPNYSPKTLHYNRPNEYTFQSEKPKWGTVFCFKVFQLPGFEDNFYTNNLDWGKQFLAFNAGKVSYIWNQNTEKMMILSKSFYDDCSIKCSLDGDNIAIGNSKGDFVIVNVPAQKTLFNQNLYENFDYNLEAAVSIVAMDWRSQNECTVASYGNVIHYDVRSRAFPWQLPPSSHRVCSLGWSPDRVLLASGGDDDKVKIYDSRNTFTPIFTYSHLASVKALKWVPESSLLFSGGGLKDGRIKLFNALKGECVSEVNTSAQICSIEYLGHNGFVSGVGAGSRKNIFICKRDQEFKIKKIQELFFKNPRVFNLSKNPNASEFCSFSSDHRLRLWKPGNKPTSNSSFPCIR